MPSHVASDCTLNVEAVIVVWSSGSENFAPIILMFIGTETAPGKGNVPSTNGSPEPMPPPATKAVPPPVAVGVNVGMGPMPPVPPKFWKSGISDVGALDPGNEEVVQAVSPQATTYAIYFLSGKIGKKLVFDPGFW